jgi:hypothetical protein
MNTFTSPERAVFRRLSTPEKIQRFMDDLAYNKERGGDHVLAIFRIRGCWGAIAKSNYSGLRYREPVYRTLRELAMSYFEHYFNPAREKTLRNYSRPVNMARFDAIQWMTAEEDLWTVPEYLTTISHRPLLPRTLIPRLGRVDDRLFRAGLLGRVE